MAESILALIELPAGERPLRTVVGVVITTGVAEPNEQYAHAMRELLASLQAA